VAEADESDASFMHLQPMIAIVTNIDNDHLATHGGDFSRLKQSFVDFLHNLPFYGLAVLCADDEHVRSILRTRSRGPYVTYGFGAGADVRAIDVRRDGLRSHSRCCGRTRRRCRSRSTCPGGTTCSTRWRRSRWPPSSASAMRRSSARSRISRASTGGCSSSARFTGGRQRARSSTTTAIIRPRSPRPSMRCARAGRAAAGARVSAAPLHPHARSARRLRRVLASADVLLVTEVYAAGEAPISGADGRAICRAVRSRGLVEPVFVERVEDLGLALRAVLKDGDVVLTMGAGNIGAVAHELKGQFAEAAA
jgi:UDP-N-acetylmuramate--alanine ligase